MLGKISGNAEHDIVSSSPRELRFRPDHANFFLTESSILDRHAEEHVFVLLVVGGKGVTERPGSRGI